MKLLKCGKCGQLNKSVISTTSVKSQVYIDNDGAFKYLWPAEEVYNTPVDILLTSSECFICGQVGSVKIVDFDKCPHDWGTLLSDETVLVCLWRDERRRTERV